MTDLVAAQAAAMQRTGVKAPVASMADDRLRTNPPRRSRKPEAQVAAERQKDDADAKAAAIAKLVRECGVEDRELLKADRLNERTLPADARHEWADARNAIDAGIGSRAIFALIHGFGTGKSTIGAAAVLRECRAGRVARYLLAWNYVEAMDVARRSFSKEAPRKVMERYCLAPLLVIDELHQQPDLFGDYNTLALRQLILERWGRGLTTVLISNDTEETFLHRIGDAVNDRMYQGGRTFTFTHTSLRTRQRTGEGRP